MDADWEVVVVDETVTDASYEPNVYESAGDYAALTEKVVPPPVEPPSVELPSVEPPSVEPPSVEPVIVESECEEILPNAVPEDLVVDAVPMLREAELIIAAVEDDENA